jgi:hypothetical protein
MGLGFSVPIYEDIGIVAVCAQENSLVVYLLNRLSRYFLDDLEKLSKLQSCSLDRSVGQEPTVFVMPSLNLTISIGPSECSHIGRRQKTRAKADFSEDSLS